MGIKGKFPDILTSDKYGDQAKILYNDAKALLREVIEENHLTADAVFGIYPANSKNESVYVEGQKFDFPRQLVDKGPDKVNYSLLR